MTSRLIDTVRFYGLLDRLDAWVGGARTLADCRRNMNWPERGVYFFFEHGESRTGSGSGPRVVRIGTHGLINRAKSTLWGRLYQQRGAASTGGGNHRGSIFRLLVGIALERQENVRPPPSWGVTSDIRSAARQIGIGLEEVKQWERGLEVKVSRYFTGMPFLCLNVDDEPSPDSQRGFIERNAVALLSDFGERAVDAPSPNWLGRHSDRGRVRLSGLWNNNHVDGTYHPSFFNVMELRIGRTERLSTSSDKDPSLPVWTTSSVGVINRPVL